MTADAPPDSPPPDLAAMFERATATADHAHRVFFGRRGDFLQVWARRSDGSLFFLGDHGVDAQVRADAHDGRLTCPYPGCPDPRFIARGGTERRHHFAHRVAGQEHRPAAAWRHQALLMLSEWTKRRYAHVEVDLEDSETLQLRSARSGRIVRLTVTYDRGYGPVRTRAGEQLLLGHSRGLLLPRERAKADGECWWCGEGRLVGEVIAHRTWALALNPQERRIATLASIALAKSAGLATGRAAGEVLCVVDELDHARLDAEGLHTPASDAIDRARNREAQRERRLMAEQAERQRRQMEAEATARTKHHMLLPQLIREPVELVRPPEASWRVPIAMPPARVPAGDRNWSHELSELRRHLDDEDLAKRLEQPLTTDVDCGIPTAIWHLMAVLEWRKRGETTHPMAIRAAIIASHHHRHGHALSEQAVQGVLDVARRDL